ncbi:hypothetical protein ACIGO9_30320 [Nocardia asteroides]|uniref:hypothetical protein n=1 Tax=Nocardia asteroides TaxID=1824 RepID=UPI0037C958C3
MPFDPDEDLKLTDNGYLPPGTDVDAVVAEGYEDHLTAVWLTYFGYGSGPALPTDNSADMADVVASADKYRRARMLRTAESTPVTPLQALAASARLIEQLMEFRAQVIDDARSDGNTWEEIGAALGMSDQAALDHHRGQRELAIERNAARESLRGPGTP